MTSYNEVYEMNRVIKNDPRLANLDACELNSIRFRYLKFAISYFMYDCRKDLNDRIDPVTTGYEFEGDGTETEFLLIPAPPLSTQCVVYLVQDGEMEMVNDFTYDVELNTVYLKTPPAPGTGVIVKAFTIGQFNEDLDVRELNILAEGMNVPYLEEAKNDENAMKYIISGKSLRFFSQANHITAMNESVNNQRYNMLDSLISEYTFKGEDDYRDLASRGNG